MTTSTPTVANADMIAFWNDVYGPRWVREQAMLDEQLDPVGEMALEVAAVKPGEVVMDIGCGCGSTTLELGRRVGPGGRVLGVDVSRPMLELARKRAEAEGLAQVGFEEADAQSRRFEPAFDLLYSRFGVMFFDDFVAAFRNLRGALKTSGRAVFLCWQALHRNPWMALPLMAAMKHVMMDQPPPAADAPGPFALADADLTRQKLEGAGFRDIEIKGHDVDLAIGGKAALDETVGFLLELGPLSRALQNVGPELRALVRDEVKDVLQPYVTSHGVRMPGAIWIISARP